MPSTDNGTTAGPPRRQRYAELRPREYLTPAEVELLMATARKRGNHRDATLILIAYRHGLRVGELCALRWDQVDLKQGRLHVNRLKGSESGVHPLGGEELRALRRLQRDQVESRHVFSTSHGAPLSHAGIRKMIARLGEVARISVLRRKLTARGYDVPVPTLVGTLVTEQLLMGITLVAVLLGVAAFVSIPGWAGKLLLVLIGVVLVIAVAAVAIEVWARYRRRQVPTETDPVEHWWHLLGISLSAIPLAMREGQALLRRPRLLLWGLATATLSWLTQMLGIYWALLAYGIHDGIGAAALVFLASNLVGLFPIVPGNLVVFQGATYTALQVYNVPTNLAITFSIGLQLIEALLGVGLGFFFLSYEGLSVGELRTEAEASAGIPEGSSAPP